MDTEEIKKKIHEYVDIADEHFLRLVHGLIENEQFKSASDSFSAATEDVVNKAKETLSTVREGLAKNLKDLEDNFNAWNKKQSNR